jgi:hypothetical protein
MFIQKARNKKAVMPNMVHSGVPNMEYYPIFGDIFDIDLNVFTLIETYPIAKNKHFKMYCQKI